MTGRIADHKTLASTIPKPAAGILKYLQLLVESFTSLPKNIPPKHRWVQRGQKGDVPAAAFKHRAREVDPALTPWGAQEHQARSVSVVPSLLRLTSLLLLLGTLHVNSSP